MDVIKTADWIIDMGPEGGDRGGTVVAVGTPEQVAQVPASHTGRFLRDVLPATDYLHRHDAPAPAPEPERKPASRKKARVPEVVAA
jgi:excinuclease ABC subunit A